VAEQEVVRQYAIYEHPLDYPEGYVVREWLITAGKVEAGEGKQAPTLEEAHKLLPDGVSQIQNPGETDEKIIEVWM
jgi:hypothetical protein